MGDITLGQVIDWVYGNSSTEGQLRELNKHVVGTLNAMQRRKAVEAFVEFKPGDKVRVKRTKPLYMTGAEGVVVRKMTTKLLIQITSGGAGRFPDGARVRVPATILEKV